MLLTLHIVGCVFFFLLSYSLGFFISKNQCNKSMQTILAEHIQHYLQVGMKIGRELNSEEKLPDIIPHKIH